MTERLNKMKKDKTMTLFCSICYQKKPIQKGCWVASRPSFDRCKECQEKLQKK